MFLTNFRVKVLLLGTHWALYPPLYNLLPIPIPLNEIKFTRFISIFLRNFRVEKFYTWGTHWAHPFRCQASFPSQYLSTPNKMK